jgi:Na+-driven multidrug efflux pump
MSFILFFTPQFVSAIGTPPEIVASTRSYLVLQSIALPFNSIATLLLTALYSMRKAKEALYLVLISVIINMAMDLFLISNTSLSIHLGIEGSALGYVASQIALFVLATALVMKFFSINLRSLSTLNWRLMIRPLFSVGGWTGLDSLVRNFGYILVPLNVLNIIGVSQYGGYELAMTVMWTVIIPVLAVTQGTNILIGNHFGKLNYADIKRTLLTSLTIVMLLMLGVSLGGVFFWNSLSIFFNQNPDMVKYSTSTFWWLIVPYCLFAVGGVLKGVFYGSGKTRFIFYISSICNFGLIIPFWVFAKLGFFPASFENVMLLFVVVFVLDLAITCVMVRTVLKQIHSICSNLNAENHC